MFSNLNWYNVVVLLLLALFIFGDKLPQILSDGLKMGRNLQRMARSATSDLSRELGTDIQLEDLHPKTFVRKHLLSEADQEALARPLKDLSDDVMKQTRGLQDGVEKVGNQAGVADEVRRAGDGGRAGDGHRAATPSVRGNGAAPQVAADPAQPPPSAPPAAPHLRYDDIT